MAKYKLTCSGNTQPAKESLKARGWKWLPEARCWYKLVSAEDANKICGGDAALLKTFGGHKKGCRLVLDGRVVWTSDTYATTEPKPQAPRRSPHAGDQYAHDAHGNHVPGIRIPGSAPDDTI